MLARTHRLTASANFATLLSTRPRGSAAMLVRVKPAAAGPIKIGFIVSKRLSLSAVTRNRARRRLREAARLLLQAEPNLAAAPFQVVITAKPATLTVPLPDLITELHVNLKAQGVPC